MNKQEVIFDTCEPKKHSVCYKTSQQNPAVTSIYIMKTALGQQFPAKIKMILEEAPLTNE